VNLWHIFDGVVTQHIPEWIVSLNVDDLWHYLLYPVTWYQAQATPTAVTPTQFWQVISVAVAIIGLHITIWIRTKPIIDVYFENGEKELTYPPNAPVTLKFLFKNNGRRTLIYGIRKKETAQALSIMIYFPMNFKIEWAERQKEKTSRIFISSQTGPLKYRQYVFVPDPLDRKPPVMTSLRFKEVEECCVRILTPNEVGKYEIHFDIASRQGDLSFKKLNLKIFK